VSSVLVALCGVGNDALFSFFGFFLPCWLSFFVVPLRVVLRLLPLLLFFRALLFKFFNKIETWEHLESKLGAVSWKSFQFDRYAKILDEIALRREAIYSAASRYGFKTISNLSGHTLDRYVVHAGKSIPNVYMPNLPTLKKGEVFAVEPFLTTQGAEGYVVDSDIETIFALVGRRRLGNEELDRLVEMIWEDRKTLPFTPRWFLKDYKEARLLSLLKELAERKVVRSYATLVEASGKPVAQFEHTMALGEEGLVILT